MKCCLCYLQTVPIPTCPSVKKLVVSFSNCRITFPDMKQPLSRKKHVCVRTRASWHSPSPSTAFEEYTLFKPWNHLQVYIICSRHLTSPWAICFQRQTHGVSQKLINKFTASFAGLENSSMDECSTDKVLMLSCQRYRYLTALED